MFDSSTSGGDALYDSYRIVCIVDRGSEETVLVAVMAAREDPDTYVGAMISPENDRWVRC